MPEDQGGRVEVSDRYLEDLQPGDEFVSPGLTVTESQIIRFALEWDPVPFHMDVELARQHEFGGLFASGFHTLCITFRLFRQTGALDGGNIAGVAMENARWFKPVRPGDTLHSVARVLETRPSRSKPDRGTVRMTHRAVNQHDETVFSVDCVHLVRRRPGSAPPG